MYMKKIFSMAVLVLVTQLSFAQYFKLTDKGFVSNENHDFAVVEVPNVKQMDVYKNVLNAINSLYSNPQKASVSWKVKALRSRHMKKKRFL